MKAVEEREKAMEIPFTKMHGLGNDYLYIDRFHYRQEHDWPELSRRMSDRHFGVGSDGLILIEPSRIADVRMRMFNSDGLEGEMCGNGVRCLAKYVYEHGIVVKDVIEVETLAGIVRPHLSVKGGRVLEVSVDMGMPRLARKDIPLSTAGPEPVLDEPIEVGGQTYYGTAVSMGNPHCVFFTDDVWAVPLEEIGPKLERHPIFPCRANIEFVAVKSREDIEMRIWERGSGITMASGTGSSASVVACVLHGKTARKVRVHLPGGVLLVEWKEDGHVWQTGPAVEVCRGEFLL